VFLEISGDVIGYLTYGQYHLDPFLSKNFSPAYEAWVGLSREKFRYSWTMYRFFIVPIPSFGSKSCGWRCRVQAGVLNIPQRRKSEAPTLSIDLHVKCSNTQVPSSDCCPVTDSVEDAPGR
jgi:hypothetical protein